MPLTQRHDDTAQAGPGAIVSQTPELMARIFIDLDEGQDDFYATSRRFRTTARTPLNICKWFERRYWPFELLPRLLDRLKFMQSDLLIETVDLAIGRAARVSRLLIRQMEDLPHPPPGAQPVQAAIDTMRLQEDVTQHFQRKYPRYVPSKPLHPGRPISDFTKVMILIHGSEADGSSIDSDSVRDLDADVGVGAGVDANLHHEKPEAGNVSKSMRFLVASKFMKNYGIPVYTRRQLSVIAVKLLAAGMDIQEWEGALHSWTGMPQIFANFVVDQMLHHLATANTLSALMCRNDKFLRIGHTSSDEYLPPAAARHLMSEAWPTFLLKTAQLFKAFIYLRHISGFVTQTIKSPTKDALNILHKGLEIMRRLLYTAGLYKQFLEMVVLFIVHDPRANTLDTGVDGITTSSFLYTTFIRGEWHLLCHPLQVMMTIKRIRQHVLDACHSKSDNVADFKQPDSVPYIVSAVIADTSYPATHIPQVLQFMQGYLGTAKDLESCVRWATLMLLRSSEGGFHLMELAKCYAWLKDYIEANWTYGLVPQELFAPLEPRNDVQAAVMEVISQDGCQVAIKCLSTLPIAEKSHAPHQEGVTALRELIGTSDDYSYSRCCMPVVMALLFILDKETSIVLRIILTKAALAGKQEIVGAYIEAGIKELPLKDNVVVPL